MVDNNSDDRHLKSIITIVINTACTKGDFTCQA